MTTRLPPGFKITRDTNTEEFFINMGPQHPSTHGALRLATSTAAWKSKRNP